MKAVLGLLSSEASLVTAEEELLVSVFLTFLALGPELGLSE